MKLYRAKVPFITRDILDALTRDADIEISARGEVELDIESVLNEYIRLEREVTERAKDVLAQQSLAHDQFGKIKRAVGDERGVPLGHDGIIWMCNQILETFMQSNHVEEIFSADSVMRRKMEQILRRHMQVDDELDVEVRQRIKNLKEGSNHWDVEYSKVLKDIRRKRGLDRD